MVFIFLYLYCMLQNVAFVLRLHQHLCQTVRVTSSGTAVWPFVFILLTFPCLWSACFLFLASTLLSNITRIAEPLTSHQVTLCVVLTAELARIPSLWLIFVYFSTTSFISVVQNRSRSPLLYRVRVIPPWSLILRRIRSALAVFQYILNKKS